MAGFDEVEILVIDDGSTDRTSEVARKNGADRVVRLPAHRGLAAAFSVGLEEALRMGADVIVNFDADLQYDPADIPALVEPVLAGRADLVVGDRAAGKLAHFSAGKRLLQRVGSWVVRQASGLEVPDAASGFRALSREAARRVNVFSRMTYTLETLIQAGSKDLRVASRARAARPTARRSRLFTSAASTSSCRAPTSCASRLSTSRSRCSPPRRPFSCSRALLLGLRYLWFYFTGQNPAGHVQSLILAAVLIVVGAQTFLIALLADLVGINRTLLEELKLRESGAGSRKPEADKTER